MSEVVEGFVRTSKAFKSYYMGMKTFFDSEDQRIRTLYKRLQLGIMPWAWDYKNYQRDPEMIGFFYPEDVDNLEALEEYERSVQQH